MQETLIIEKQPLWVRCTHWINFPTLMIMIWSGAILFWAHRPQFFPDKVYAVLGLKFRLAEAMSYHFTFMWIFALNGFIYVCFLLKSGQWREFVIRRRDFSDALQVIKADLGKGPMPTQTGKFNAAQKITYTGSLLLGVLAVLTGIAIYKPVQTSPLIDALGGYQLARAIHDGITVAFVLFFFVHVIQVIRAGWNHFRAMVAGYEIVSKEPHGD